MDKTSPNDKQAYSLASIVKEVETKLTVQRLRDKFWCKLAQKGCLKYQIDRYSEPLYRIAENRIYKVGSNFPRLSRANVQSEVTAVKYSISLSSIDKYRVQSI